MMKTMGFIPTPLPFQDWRPKTPTRAALLEHLLKVGGGGRGVNPPVTFGNTVPQAFQGSNINYMFGMIATPGGGNGTLDKISVYTRAAAGTANIMCALYLHSTLVRLGMSGNTVVNTTAQWWDCAMSGEALTNGTAYLLEYISDANAYRYHDLVTAGGHQENVGAYAFTNPMTPVHVSYLFSIYGTYTPS